MKRSELKEVMELINEVIAGQQKKVYRCAQKIIPHITEDDLLQPNDFSELEHHPHFRYEEGMLAGMFTVLMALQATYSES